ncbi:protein of unknown function [Muriicola jejuensis]|uniref:DUF4105 domain-containing protein n=1 Tax=Muriicola jejuensis TaxID=504488 RepID=A0A6P0UCL1_9FLAO|nr:DUF4105 domain-containing protein [Muriicola jejuensis]NER09043.1 DUF4105 domain-containing protein [Muriicola jejuensis]SMP11894.1 protein of unknown function [Muriicola jejuensis]
MTLKQSIFLLILFFVLPLRPQAEPLSDKSVISVITCGPGSELYSTFGHSAFRLQDREKGIDWIYNYGTFNFNTPNFYSKFARGKLLYSLSKQRFENFLYAYELENRWVKEQILDLTPNEKNEVFAFLENNYKPQNRDYKYDFLLENCSTKIPEVLQVVLGDEIVFTNYLQDSHKSFRDLIQENLVRNSWSSFGIDLALGAVIDREATYKQHMFLPEYVYFQLEHTLVGEKPIVARERTILDYNLQNRGNYFTSSPLFWTGLLFLFTATITYIDLRNKVRSRVMDILLFLLTGLSGCLIVFLWFFTDHTATALNLNVLWAFPLNLILTYFLIRFKKLPRWAGPYLILLLILLAISVLVWAIGIQHFSPIAAVLLLTLGLRYGFLLYHARRIEPTSL